jgi:hypothetical protein
MFNSNPIIRSVPIHGDHRCYIVDEALADPDAWVERAALHRDDFVMQGHNAYPGVELALPDGISERLSEFFAVHIRKRLGARRIQRAHSRLSIVTLPPENLQPRQWICHRDRMGLGLEHRIGASVLYLFKDHALGGTNLFMPKRAALDIDLLVHESGPRDRDAFARKYGISRGYLTESNDWFEKVAGIAPEWNRMIFHDGTLFHCSDIPAPEKLSTDPTCGRLTLNGFFHCTRRAA